MRAISNIVNAEKAHVQVLTLHCMIVTHRIDVLVTARVLFFVKIWIWLHESWFLFAEAVIDAGFLPVVMPLLRDGKTTIRKVISVTVTHTKARQNTPTPPPVAPEQRGNVANHGKSS
eukprot:4627323-Amphidinium_carterae.2